MHKITRETALKIIKNPKTPVGLKKYWTVKVKSMK